MRSSILHLSAAAALATLAACGPTRVNVAPVKIEPIHMTIDVNLRDGAQPPPK
jgi:hypothetical protein